jgi:hypothetical protein
MLTSSHSLRVSLLGLLAVGAVSCVSTGDDDDDPDPSPDATSPMSDTRMGGEDTGPDATTPPSPPPDSGMEGDTGRSSGVTYDLSCSWSPGSTCLWDPTEDDDGFRAIEAADDGSIYALMPTESQSTALAKYNPDGTRAWTSTLGSDEFGGASALRLENGDVYIAGQANAGSFAGRSPDKGNFVGFAARFDDAGQRQTLWTWGVSYEADVGGVAAADSGGVYVTGALEEALVDDNSVTGKTDAHVAKFDAEGNLVWSRLIGTEAQDEGRDVLVADDGSIYATGTLWRKTNDEDRRAYLVKYAPDGTQAWEKRFGSKDLESRGHDLTLGSNGDVYLTGEANFQEYDAFDGFVARYASDGTRKKLWKVGSDAADYGHDLAIAEDGTLHLTGRFFKRDSTGREVLAGETYGGGRYDVYVASFDPSGSRTSFDLIGDKGEEESAGVTLDADGNVVVAGRTDIAFDSGNDTEGDEMGFLWWPE